MRKAVSTIALCSLLMLCGRDCEADERDLVIYLPGSYTGIMPFLADGIEKAARIFVKETNAEGGLLGRKLRIVIQDDKADLEAAAKNATEALADSNHLVTIGHSFSSVALPVGKLYNEKNKLFFTPYATNSRISKLKGTVFQLCFNDKLQARALAQVALKKIKAKRILVLTNATDVYSDGLSKDFQNELKAIDPSSKILNQRYLLDKMDLKKLASLIKREKPELVFFPELKVHAANIVRRLSDQNIPSDIRYLGADGWGSEKGTIDIFFSGANSKSLQKYLYTYHYHDSLNTKENKRIVAIFKKSGLKAYGPGVLTYEALCHLKKTINKYKTVNNKVLSNKIRGSRYIGTTGEVYFHPEGHTVRNPVLLELSKNELRFVSIVKVITKPKQAGKAEDE